MNKFKQMIITVTDIGTRMAAKEDIVIVITKYDFESYWSRFGSFLRIIDWLVTMKPLKKTISDEDMAEANASMNVIPMTNLLGRQIMIKTINPVKKNKADIPMANAKIIGSSRFTHVKHRPSAGPDMMKMVATKQSQYLDTFDLISPSCLVLMCKLP